jgi:hypothetical protein
MSKLTDTLKNQISGQMKNVTISFDADMLDRQLLKKLGIYLSTKSTKKLIETSFAMTSSKKLDNQHSIIDQIQYRPAKRILDILSQQSQSSNEKKIKRASVPRWMVLVIGSEIDSINGKAPDTVEDAINIVFRLCLSLLEKSLGDNEQTTKKAG